AGHCADAGNSMSETPSPPATSSTPLRRPLPRWLHRGFWRRKVVFILGACLIGLLSAGFAWAADVTRHWFSLLRETAPLAVLPLTVIGFIAAAQATAKWFPTARGSGIPQVIA